MLSATRSACSQLAGTANCQVVVVTCGNASAARCIVAGAAIVADAVNAVEREGTPGRGSVSLLHALLLKNQLLWPPSRRRHEHV